MLLMLTAIHVTVDGNRTYERLLLFFTWPFSLILFFSFNVPISFIPQSVVMVSWWLAWNAINLIGRSCSNFCLTHKCGGFSILIRRLWWFICVIFQPLDSDGEDPADGDTSTTASSKHGGQSGPKKSMGKTSAIACESSSDGELVEIPEQ